MVTLASDVVFALSTLDLRILLSSNSRAFFARWIVSDSALSTLSTLVSRMMYSTGFLYCSSTPRNELK